MKSAGSSSRNAADCREKLKFGELGRETTKNLEDSMALVHFKLAHMANDS